MESRAHGTPSFPGFCQSGLRDAKLALCSRKVGLLTSRGTLRSTMWSVRSIHRVLTHAQPALAISHVRIGLPVAVARRSARGPGIFPSRLQRGKLIATGLGDLHETLKPRLAIDAMWRNAAARAMGPGSGIAILAMFNFEQPTVTTLCDRREDCVEPIAALTGIGDAHCSIIVVFVKLAVCLGIMAEGVAIHRVSAHAGSGIVQQAQAPSTAKIQATLGRVLRIRSPAGEEQIGHAEFGCRSLSRLLLRLLRLLWWRLWLLLRRRLLGLLGLRLLGLRLLGLRLLGLGLLLGRLRLLAVHKVITDPLNDRRSRHPRVERLADRAKLGHMRRPIEQMMNLASLRRSGPMVGERRAVCPVRIGPGPGGRQQVRAASRHHHIRNTPKRVPSSTGAFNVAANASPRTSRVCAGSMMPSSHNRAVACQGLPCAS